VTESLRTSAMHHIVAGFIPLTDCAVLVAAKEKGFAAEENIDLVLVREASWANIRDRVSVGHFDVAHMLAPMVLAANLGLAPLPAKMIAPMAMGRGGNTITVSRALFESMRAEGAPDNGDPARTALALAHALAKHKNPHPPVFAIVHPHSSHHYELALWLRSAGLLPGRDVELTVLPPGLMGDALASGQIAGFCAGEPWGSQVALAGVGEIVTTSPAIWRAAPGKVLGVRQSWAESNDARLAALVRALFHAARWCDVPANRGELAQILSRDIYLAQPRAVIEAALCGVMRQNALASTAPGGMFAFAESDAAYPWPNYALFYYAQMVLAGQAAWSVKGADIAKTGFRPDLLRSALASDPSAALPPETGDAVLDGFFDGQVFDPARAADYISRFSA
jgi:ABC-type nitrate/sulfonate/bicarbonate transport system substrate-binding protein